MGLFDKFKKKKYNELTNNVNKNIKTKIINKVKTRDIVEDTLKQIEEETITIEKAITKTKTLERLDVLEAFATWAATTILDNQVKLNALDDFARAEIQKIWDRINNLNLTQADTVLDTTDNQYKNVKQIIIDKSINSNQILYQGRYDTIENILADYTPPIEPPKEVDYAKKAGVATLVQYAGGVHSVDDILSDYFNITIWSQIINNSTTFEEFKTNLINALKLQGGS